SARTASTATSAPSPSGASPRARCGNARWWQRASDARCDATAARRRFEKDTNKFYEMTDDEVRALTAAAAAGADAAGGAGGGRGDVRGGVRRGGGAGGNGRRSGKA